MKQNYRFIIAYDGSRFSGWQHQPDKDTVQGRIENVLERMVEEPVEVIGAGRTDAGVHARGMVANAVFDTAMTTDEICAYMNRYLPDDIGIVSVKKAGDRFHARYNARGKTYRYRCYVGRQKPVFDRKYVYILDRMPDLVKMQEVAKLLCGEHDFRNFCMNPRMKKSTVRLVDRIDIVQNGDEILFDVHGTGFLQNMVRILVGTLLEVGFGNMQPADVEYALHATERIKAGPTAPANGLCLMQVDYD